MSTALLVSLCLICGNHGRRVQNALGTDSNVQDNSDLSLETLATVLLAINPNLKARFGTVHPAVSHARTLMMSVTHQTSTQGVKVPRTRSPVMSGGISQSTMDLASNCLMEGCPVDMVTDLLEKLKAEENPSEEAVKAMGQLEKLLAAEKPNKNGLEKFVTDLTRTFSVLDAKEPLGYTEKAGKGGWSYKFKSWDISKSTMDLASNCLEEGCPVDMVTDLVEKLKAQENPSEEAVKAIRQLEEMLASDKPNKNELEKFVMDLTRTFTVVKGKEPLGYTGKAGKGGWSYKFKSWDISKTTMDLASNCLEEGCPVDMVTDLVEKLKAQENPGEEAVMALEQLEKLLASEKPNKNELEKFVTDLTRTFTVLDDKEALGYTGKPGKGGYMDEFSK